ncbi:MAG: AMP-binding protein, partial [Polyangiaceae bacterium]|nr:AMP-binding protein [Polyangiaceae bacterium]
AVGTARPIEHVPAARVDRRAPALPELETLTDALRWHARTHPERPHATIEGPSGVRETLRYGELFEGAERCARGLLELGVARGDRVALMLPTGSDYLRCFCATLLLGVVPVPVYPPARLASIEEHMSRQQRILANAQVAALVSVREALPLARLLRSSIPSLRAVVTPDRLARSGPIPRSRVGGEDVALIQYTSGSTGDPKGVVLTHRNLVANVRAMGQAVRLDVASDVMVSWLPLYHDMGLIGGFLAGLYLGFPTLLMSPLAFLARPERWLWAIHDARGTISPAPNFGYELCVSKVRDADIEGLDLGSWRFALNGAEPVVARTIERFCERFGPYGFRRGAMGPSYGLAECAVAVAFPPMMRGPLVDRILRKPLARGGSAIPAPASTPDSEVAELVACGRPLPNHKIRIVDRSGRELP